MTDAWNDEGFGAEVEVEDELAGFDDAENDPEDDETLDALDDEGDD
jgi:hypothetical protein